MTVCLVSDVGYATTLHAPKPLRTGPRDIQSLLYLEERKTNTGHLPRSRHLRIRQVLTGRWSLCLPPVLPSRTEKKEWMGPQWRSRVGTTRLTAEANQCNGTGGLPNHTSVRVAFRCLTLTNAGRLQWGSIRKRRRAPPPATEKEGQSSFLLPGPYCVPKAD